MLHHHITIHPSFNIRMSLTVHNSLNIIIMHSFPFILNHHMILDSLETLLIHMQNLSLDKNGGNKYRSNDGNKSNGGNNYRSNVGFKGKNFNVGSSGFSSSNSRQNGSGTWSGNSKNRSNVVIECQICNTRGHTIVNCFHKNSNSLY